MPGADLSKPAHATSILDFFAKPSAKPDTVASGIAANLYDTTDSDFAGKMVVSESDSGIRFSGIRQYQGDAIRALGEKILPAGSFAGLLALPTGAGKTMTATYWLLRDVLDKGGKVVWLAHRHELLNQALAAFVRVCHRDVARNKKEFHWRIISGQHDKPARIKPSDDIIIAGKSSLYRGMEYFAHWLEASGGNVVLVVDEAHHATAMEYRKLIDGIKACSKNFKMLGLTATPFRTAEKENGLLAKLFVDDIVYKINLRDLVETGVLSKPIFKSAATGVNMAELFAESGAEAVLERIAKERFFDIDTIGEHLAGKIAEHSGRNKAIVAEYIGNRNAYGQTLVFALNVGMAIALAALFDSALRKIYGDKPGGKDGNGGKYADFVVSDIRDKTTGATIASKDNIEKIDRFREGELKVLINVNILTEGVDIPGVQTVFLTRPTKSVILMTQMIGRGLRGKGSGGTEEAYIVSFIDEWADRIAWVNPEQLFIDETATFEDKTRETQKEVARLVSIAKMEEFARLANDMLDPSIRDLPFEDRLPYGICRFSYLEPGADGDDIEKLCNILIFDCMKGAYEQLFSMLADEKRSLAEDAELLGLADFADAMLFGKSDLLLGHSKQDIVDVLKYYRQTQDIPEIVLFSDRNEYDISKLARAILDRQMRPNESAEFINGEWDRAEGRWGAFFGIRNFMAFKRVIDDEVNCIQYPKIHERQPEKPLMEKEKIQIRDLPLFEIKKRYPDLHQRLRDEIYEKARDADGFYHSAASGFKSKRRIDFQIDHIIPRSKGGATLPNNLQLLKRSENWIKSDTYNLSWEIEKDREALLQEQNEDLKDVARHLGALTEDEVAREP
jgi:superfamily II DNA or RNA helicase